MSKRLDPTEIQALGNVDPVVHAPARLMLLTYLTVVDSADFLYLMNLTGLTFGNLSAHLSKLAEVGYVEIEKGHKGQKSFTLVRLTLAGRQAFAQYRERMRTMLDMPTTDDDWGIGQSRPAKPERVPNATRIVSEGS
jgi:DNA-binding MarR family transcriptional regulator